MQTFGKFLVGSMVAFGLVATSPAIAAELALLTWEGYADDSFVKEFEQSSGCEVTATYVGSNDDFAPKLAAGGGVYDLISPSIDTTGVMVAAGLVEPIDKSKITDFDKIFPQFAEAKGINVDGELWGVPFTWGSIPFMYRTDKITEEPTSLADLWDPKYEGKVSLWDDKSSIYVAARLNGDTNIYNLSPEQMENAKQKLIEQKPLVRKYWSTAGELVNLYANGEVWISNTWGGYQSAELQKQGIPVKEFIPKENAEGWMDSWQIVKGSKNTDCAYQWINYSISPMGQCGVANVTGYSVSNAEAAKSCMSDEQFDGLHMDDVDYINRLILWETPEGLENYINTWNAVKAAN
ncbi:MAG: ABC transporter substrate-binding protein [Gammaproteobacteria bacterium]|nr:ABC transporter substrate-binding protein [Gammaproteobacteria bacterium]